MSHSHSRRAARLGAASLVVAATAVAAAPAQAQVPAFYNPPAASSLPAQNGALIRSEPMRLGASVQLPGVSQLPGKATRIMYRSTDTNGQPVAVTGTYIEPSTRWTRSGPRPLVTYAEGTQGQGDACAPSRGLENPIGLNPGSLNIGYEVPNIYALLNRGFAVVVTDYVGLGATDRLHTYVNRVDQGRAVLDAARVASKVPGASVTSQSPVGAYGYSQGGGASASAAELQPVYAPDVKLKGAFVGAPPADLNAVMRQADGTLLTAVIGFAVNGFVQTYPELGPILDANTNNAGKQALRRIQTMCIGDAIANFAFSKTNQWTADGRSISTIISGLPQVQARVNEQRIGRLRPSVPVRITTGTQDDIVPHAQAKQLALDWCSRGATVEYFPIVQWLGTGGTAVNHLGPMLTEADRSASWMSARLLGASGYNNCGWARFLP